MLKKTIPAIACTCLSVISINTHAAIISVDWKSSGDNLITLDTDNGLAWLDLSVTSGRTYDDISTKLDAGQEFDGWRYAAATEVSGFWDTFGGDNNFYNGPSIQNNGLFADVSAFWGDLFCMRTACESGTGRSFAITADVSQPNFHNMARLSDRRTRFNDPLTEDDFDLFAASRRDNSFLIDAGSALVRDISSVPIPAAVWLFGSGLLALIGLSRRKA